MILYPEPVRRRVSMYIGSQDEPGIRELLRCVMEQGLGEALAGHASEMLVAIGADGETVTVEDNGRGVLFDCPPDRWAWAFLELMSTQNPMDSHVWPGSWGWAFWVANALSDDTAVRVWHGRAAYEQRFSRGASVGPLVVKDGAGRHGTSITFHPDPELFGFWGPLDETAIGSLVDERAALYPGISIRCESARTGNGQVHCYPEGLRDFVASLTRGQAGAFPQPPFSAEGAHGGVVVSVALQFAPGVEGRLHHFADGCRTVQGTHVDGFVKAFHRAVGQAASASGLDVGPAQRCPRSTERLPVGVVAALHVRIAHPSYESASRGVVVAQEADAAVQRVFGPPFSAYLQSEPGVCRRVVELTLRHSG